MTETAPLGAPPPIRSDPVPGPVRFALHLGYDAVLTTAAIVSSVWWIPRVMLDPVFREMVKRRLGFGLKSAPPERVGKRIVVHGVSVGEVKAASSIVERLRVERPDLEVVISTTTATGAEVARRVYPDLEVVRFPFDFSFVVSRFLRRLAPAAVVLVELEVWPNFLRGANRAGVPIAVVNGRITERSHRRYHKFRKLMPQFQRISLFCVQDEAYAARFEDLSHDGDRILVTGNVKADSLKVGMREPNDELARHLGGTPGQLVFVAGSTHDPEEQLVAKAWLKSAPESRLILVPRHPERAETICRELSELGAPPQRLSFLREGIESSDPSRPAIVDTIGELEDVYALADLVFVGGSLIPHGGQNMLEPAAQGRPIVYGPHTHNFSLEAALLERMGASRRLVDPGELASVLVELLGNAEVRASMSQAGLEAVRTQQGATVATTRAFLERCLSVPES